MCKQATGVFGIVLFLASLANAAGITASAYSGDEILLLRAGIETAKGFEFGVQGEGVTQNNFWEQDCTLEKTLIGGYVNWKIDLGPRWHVDPVVGLQGSAGLDIDGYHGGPEAGIGFNLHENISVSGICQYRWHSSDIAIANEDGIYWFLGTRVRF